MKSMKVAECVADRLRRLGVKYVFGMPGGSSIPYMEAYRQAGMEYILVSHEASAGIMAAVTGRLTGVPGVCHSTFGPGAANMATGVGSAFLDRSPLIAFSDEIAGNMINRTVQMNINHQELFTPLTKATFRAHASDIEEILEEAASLCNLEYPGPVHIGLPVDIAGEIVKAGTELYKTKVVKAVKNDSSKIISALRGSERPLMAVGLTSARLLKQNDLSGFLERHRMPVVITPMAKGLIPEEHPCYAGVLFHALSDRLKSLFDNTDLIIGLGYDPVEYNYESWMPGVPLVHFNTVETDLPSGPDINQYTGSPGEWFRLLEMMEHSSGTEDLPVVRGVKNEMKTLFASRTHRFGPVTVLKVLKEELPSGALLTADVGSHLHLAGQYWETGGRQNLIMSNGWSGMGFGIPAALAAKLVNPSSVVVCLTGDGGFLMTAGEIMTARRYNLRIIIVVFADGELNLIKLKKSRQNLSQYGTSIYPGDLFGSGTFLGIPVFDAGSEKELRGSVQIALTRNEPVIINARIDPDDYPLLISGRS
jgi:acetolactate synthase-1/2/3 large subunit